MIRVARRLGVAGMVVGLALAGLIVGAGTAGAIDKRCYNLGGMISLPMNSTPVELHAWYQRECYYPVESVTPLPVSIQRYNPSDGTWTTVASGTGETTYVCHFSTTRTYRWTAGSPSGTPFNCG